MQLAHSAGSPECLHVDGPYAVVRHPFYSSYLLFWIGTAIIAGPVQWILVSILLLWYVVLARHEERRFEATALIAAYRQYSRRTGMLVPKLRRDRRAVRSTPAT